MLELSDVNGPETCELYTVLKSETDGSDITWNFASYFLVDRTGVISRYNGVSPNGMKAQIEAALGAAAPSL